MPYTQHLEKMSRYFLSGVTRPYAFRKAQLKRFRQCILDHEQEIYEALHADLRKSPEEVWTTETGQVIGELNHAIRNLRNWMEPQHVATNLVNLPSGSRIMREPMGVVLVVGPWNYPILLLLSPVVGAIAAGNCVVIKPSELAPATTAVMKKMIEAYFPPEYIWYAEGEGASVVPAMMDQFRFDHIFFTGSTTVGHFIYKKAAEKLVPVTLELGGKSPCVVAADAHIRVAARRIAVAKFSNSGQMCVAPDYVLVDERRKEKLIDELINAIKKFFGERPDESYSYCRMINERQFDRVTTYLGEGTIVHGGQSNRADLYIEPTIITDLKPGSLAMTEEIFGPVLPVISYRHPEEAREIISRNPNPLAFYVFTSSKKHEEEWLDWVPAGGVCVNNCSWHLTNHHLPFGGRGFSGTGQYHGQFSFETFSHRKAVMKTPTWFDPDVKYPPFEGKLGLIRRFIR